MRHRQRTNGYKYDILLSFEPSPHHFSNGSTSIVLSQLNLYFDTSILAHIMSAPERNVKEIERAITNEEKGDRKHLKVGGIEPIIRSSLLHEALIVGSRKGAKECREETYLPPKGEPATKRTLS